MKKLISLILVSLTLSLFVFAGSWKPYDVLTKKKLNKLVSTFNLQECDTTNSVNTVYKSEDGSNWIYIYKIGNPNYNDKYIYEITFMYLDGVFDSCTKYGAYTKAGETTKYLYAVITESNTAAAKTDYYGGNWYWKDPQQLFIHLFYQRMKAFDILKINMNLFGITIPDEVIEKYNYFNLYYNENNLDPEIKIKLANEYKKYLKEHKTN